VGSADSCVEFSASKTSMSIHSALFKLACYPRWQCGRAQIITLSADDPKIFALFLAWVQTGRIESSEYFAQVDSNAGKSRGASKSSKLCAQWDQLCSCFIYGDFLQAHSFQNRVLDLLVINVRMQQLYLGTISISNEQNLLYIYEHTTRTSPLRKLVIDVVITSPSHDIPNYDFSNSHLSEYLVDLAGYAIDQAKGSRLRGKPCNFKVPWRNDPCRYHLHLGHAVSFSCTGTASRPWGIQ
jgi:hypothetical protein